MASPEHSQAAALLAQGAGLRRLALALTREAELADDAVQETVLAALERPPDIGLPLGPWLARVARNWIAKSKRTRHRRLAHEARAAREPAIPSTVELVARAELHRELVAVVLALEPRQRDAILLRYLEGLAPREIAARLDVPLRTVNTRLARGLARLRGNLDRAGGGRERWFVAFADLSRAPLALGVLAMKLKLLAALLIASAALLGLRLVSWHDMATVSISGGNGTSEASSLPTAENPVVAESRITVPPSASLAGEARPDPERDLLVTVVTTSGAPVSGASLAVVSPTARQLPGLLEQGAQVDPPLALARTDGEGRCRFSLEPLRLYDVTAVAPGLARVAARNLYAGEQLRIVLPRAANLRGTVVSSVDGAPVAQALVRVQLGVVHTPGDTGSATTTDAEGRFDLRDLPSEFVHVNVNAEGYPRFDERVGVIGEGEVRELRLVLTPGIAVRGQVTDGATKLPIGGATVELVRSQDVNRATTDEDGRYVLHGAVRGEATPIAAHAPGYGDFQVTAQGAAQDEVEQDIFLLPGRRAKGRVVDARGTSIANAVVVARASDTSVSSHQFETRRATTDDAGRFLLQGLRVDLRHTLLVHAAGRACAVRDFPQGEWETMELDLGDVVLTTPAVIAGHVRDPSGKAVAGRWVLLDGEPRERDAWGPAFDGPGYEGGEGFGFGRILARTDERGRYAFGDLPGGHYRVWAGDKGYPRGAELRLDVGDGEQLLDVDLELVSEPSIRGVVVDPDGRPLPDMVVNLWTSDAPPTRATYALTAANGSFALCGLESGTYRIDCRAFGFPSLTSPRVAPVVLRAVAAGTTDLRIVMPRAVETRLRVLGPDGRPVLGAVVLGPSELLEECWDLLGSTGPDGTVTLWLAESTTRRLRVAPPVGLAVGAYVPVLDASGTLDRSFEVEVPDVRAGSAELAVRFSKLP